MFEIQSKEKVNATFEFYDIAGLVKGASKGEGLGNQFLAAIRECDAIVEVVRCFENANVVRYNDDPVNPKNDIDVINLELSMSDLESVNNRIGKQESKARITKDKTALYEMPILLALKETLEQGTPARLTKGLSQEQMDYARKNFFLLTLNQSFMSQMSRKMITEIYPIAQTIRLLKKLLTKKMPFAFLFLAKLNMKSLNYLLQKRNKNS